MSLPLGPRDPEPATSAFEITTADKAVMLAMLFAFGVMPLLYLIGATVRDAWRARGTAWRLAAPRAPRLPRLPRARVLRR